MKINFIVAASCLLLSYSSVTLAVVDITTLKGPTTNTAVPAANNGTVTDPATTTFGSGTTSRLALYVPSTVYSDYPGWLPLYKALVFQGIPVRVTKDIAVAKTHGAVLAYQGLQSKYLGSTDAATWSTYVSGGKTLIAIGLTSTDTNLKTTFGVTPDTTTNKNAREVIVLNPPSAAYPATSVNSMFDMTDVRDKEIPLWRDDLDTGFTTIGYTLAASTAPNGVFALGSYRTSAGVIDTKAGITIKSTANGGKAVAIGLDLGAFIGESNGGKTNGIPRSYDAQYEPGYDNFIRLIKQLYVTSTSTGLVTSWPVPGNMGVHFSWTYDIDAQDSYELAYTVAKDLQSRGIGGTINWQAKLVKDAYDIASFSHYYRNISAVEALGNMELASHSVSHSPNLLNFPCTNTSATGPWTTNIPGATTCDTPNDRLYFFTLAGSLLGEARVSKYILESISINNSTVVSYRTGHLLYPDALPQVLAATGYKYSSSGACNDQMTHMPYQPFYNLAYNQAVDIIEFPLTASDEDGQINGDWAAPGSAQYPNGSYAYNQAVLINKIAKYGGQYTFLIHPTTAGLPGLTQTLFSDKFAFQQTLTPKITNVSYFDTMSGRGDFHSARIASGIDVAVVGTTATVTVTLTKPIRDLTLKVPTAWAFASSTVGVKATPGAVVLLNTVAAGTVTLTFKTSGTVASTSAPAPGPTKTTTTISIASPTVPPPTPTPNNPRMVDDFADPSRYSSEQNAMGYYTGDDGTVTYRTSVQGDWLMLSVNPTSYWYTLLGPADTCNDFSAYKTLSLAVRYPTTTRVGFNVVIQDVDAASCSEMTQHPFNATALINAATPVGPDNWLHLDLPLTNFGTFDAKSLKAVTLSGFTVNGQVEVDYLYFS
ncbi:hypothetical protein MVEG_06178 [Podila verticillata NRRL 6337]|nr:hypothetical protein MVEG_06178 [Podila verticillata NRRL 6337]